jgi:hypothetical protein
MQRERAKRRGARVNERGGRGGGVSCYSKRCTEELHSAEMCSEPQNRRQTDTHNTGDRRQNRRKQRREREERKRERERKRAGRDGII